MNDRLEGALFRRSPAGAVALTLVAVGLGGWGLVNSPIFDVRRIHVVGAAGVSEEEIRDLAAVRSGENLLRLSLDGVAARVMRSPWVRGAVVERDLPDRLVITVHERTAAGWLEDPAGTVLVARDGTILAAGGVPPRGLPSLGISPERLDVGRRIPATVPLRVAASMGSRLLGRIRGIAVQGTEALLALRGGGTVRYGGTLELRAKNRALAAMLEWARRETIDVEEIDVRVPSAPALLPASSAGPLTPPVGGVAAREAAVSG